MKHSGSVEIAKPRHEVVEYFLDPTHLGEYQDGFVKKELLSGRASQQGAVSKMYYQYGNRDMELTETVTNNSLPNLFEANYHHKHMDNTMKCRFIELSRNRTRYDYEFEYTRINWVMPRLMSILFPGMYRKQGDKWMRQFKEFVEKQ